MREKKGKGGRVRIGGRRLGKGGRRVSGKKGEDTP